MDPFVVQLFINISGCTKMYVQYYLLDTLLSIEFGWCLPNLVVEGFTYSCTVDIQYYVAYTC